MNHTRITRVLQSVLSICVLALAILFGQTQTVHAQWATNGNNINNTNTGNVGIGTTNPQAKVELHHSSATTDPNNLQWADLPLAIRNTSNTNGNLSIISFVDAAGWGDAHIGVTYTNQSAHTADLFFSTRNAGTFGERVRIKGDGKVGIGINSPSAPLQLNSAAAGFSSIGQFLITDSADVNRNLRFGYDSSLESGWIQASKIGSSYKPLLLNPNAGNVGIGTTAPASQLHVTSGTDATTNLLRIDTGVHGGTNFAIGGTANNESFMDMSVYRGGQYFSRFGVTNLGEVYLQSGGGNVGIGTTSPSTKLHVVGDVTVSGNLAAKFQDVAEWVQAAQALPPGTVVTLSLTQSNFVEASSKAYDTRVAGVISEKPGITLGESGENKVLVATTGRVRIKVDATTAPIGIGDLLVTSEKVGVAMKSVPVNLGGVDIHRPGTLIGKALEPLAKGQGEILVLLSLQ